MYGVVALWTVGWLVVFGAIAAIGARRRRATRDGATAIPRRRDRAA